MAKLFFIFEMANNHMGDMRHGMALVRTLGSLAKDFPEFEFGVKLQYRDLDTFVHSSYKGRNDIKYVKRFEETRLSADQFEQLIEAVRKEGLRTICTPFDERSVDLIERHRIEIIKIGSCSFTDWPLLERVAKSDKPVIASTAGARLEEIDNVVGFMTHRDKSLALMHCVAEYPTADDRLNLNRIAELVHRYPNVRIGYSTHERPTLHEPVMLAIARGATVFEKHVGLPTDGYALNDYSASPEQVRAWLGAARRAQAMLGSGDPNAVSQTERDTLHQLRRGLFTTRAVRRGELLTPENVEFAFPPIAGQLTANDWSKYAQYRALQDVPAGVPVLTQQVEALNLRAKVLDIVSSVKRLLKAGNIVVPGRSELEISHHYGLGNFSKFGLTMITVVNRGYCKKLLVVLPGQTHPEQYHKKKEETFHVLYGSVSMTLDGQTTIHGPGSVVTIEPEVRHAFSSEHGAVIEEISSTHYKDDSFYTDPEIGRNDSRKTHLSYWLT